MNCEFIDDWRWLDLTGANIDACLKQLGGKDFSAAKMAHVNFSLSDPQASLDLSHTRWNSADLTGATFTSAVLDRGDFTGAMLTAANLTDIQAKGTIFTGAQLKADQINGKLGPRPTSPIWRMLSSTTLTFLTPPSPMRLSPGRMLCSARPRSRVLIGSTRISAGSI